MPYFRPIISSIWHQAPTPATPPSTPRIPSRRAAWGCVFAPTTYLAILWVAKTLAWAVPGITDDLARPLQASAALIILAGFLFLQARSDGLSIKGLPPGWPSLSHFGFGAAAFLGCWLAGFLLLVPFKGSLGYQIAYKATEGYPVTAALLVFIVLTVVHEELLFRAYLMSLCESAWGPRAAIIAQAASFAVFHVVGFLHAGVLLWYFCVGLAFAWAYRRGGLWSAVLAHAVINIICFSR